MNNDLPTFQATIPCCGGDHGLHGIYMWGAPLDQRYMNTKARTYHATSQHCTIKSSSLNEFMLNKKWRDTSLLKFDGKLEVEKDAATIDHLNKDELLEAVKNVINCYGL
jgi:hypothetical protein